MKNLHYFMLIVLIFGVQTGWAQFNFNDGISYGFKIIPMESSALNTIEGSPYLDEFFEKGTVHAKGKEPLEALLRYNVPKERMEVKFDKNDSEVYSLSLDSDIKYRIGNREFNVMKIRYDGKDVFGYFEVLYPGKQVQLLKKYSAELSEPYKAKNSYQKDRPAEIQLKENYYLKLPQNEIKQVETSHRKLKKEFSSREVENYLRDNKIKDEADLIAFSKFLDQKPGD